MRNRDGQRWRRMAAQISFSFIRRGETLRKMWSKMFIIELFFTSQQREKCLGFCKMHRDY